MIRAYVTPQTNQLSITIPDGYVGKKVEVLVLEELEGLSLPDTPKRGSVAHLRGSLHLSKEQSASLDEHIKNVRNEWDRTF